MIVMPCLQQNDECSLTALQVEGSKKRVMGVAQKAIATQVCTPAFLLWDVPDSWSLAEAATVPVAYATAYYSLVVRGRLREGFSVLIHSGSGAVGLAAIQICLSRGCQVRDSLCKSSSGPLKMRSEKVFSPAGGTMQIRVVAE